MRASAAPDRSPPPPAASAAASLRPPRFGAFRTISALVIREMGTTYGRSPGGYVWAVLEPLGIILILATAFSFIVRTPSLGTSFILFYATGWMSYGFYTEIESKTRRSLRSAAALLAYPRVTWLDTVLARTLLASLTEMTTMVIIFAGLLAVLDAQVALDMVPVLQALMLAGLLGLGVGLVDSLLGGLSQLWTIFWGIITRPLMIGSGVLFVYEDMPPLVRDILWWNPLMHVTGLFRRGFYATYDAPYVSLTYCFGVAGVLILLGLIFMRSYYQMVLEG